MSEKLADFQSLSTTLSHQLSQMYSLLSLLCALVIILAVFLIRSWKEQPVPANFLCALVIVPESICDTEALIPAMERYVKSSYKKYRYMMDESIFTSSQVLSEDGSITAKIRCSNYKLEQCLNVKWHSQWTLANGGLSGFIKYEIGDHQVYEFNEFENVPVENPMMANQVVAAIKKVEGKYQQLLEREYDHLQKSTN